MYDLSKEFEKFYTDEVVLPRDKQNNLRNKRDINVRRLKNGLKEYNEEKKTSYSVKETFTQGSMAMHTTIQNDDGDFDIDVAIVFEASNIGSLGPLSVRNIVADAINRKRGNLSTPAEVKTNCVRVNYTEGYHVDFAVFRRSTNSDGSYLYEHGGSQWRSRDPKAIATWFSDEIKNKGVVLRKAVRLLKTFCRSRKDWQMPAGLIQTVLSDEQIDVSYTRLDELFYYLMKAIRDRLNLSIEVYNPTDADVNLLLKQSDRDKVENLCTRLNTYIDKLSVLFEYGCTKPSAYEAWEEVFNHDYWHLNSQNENAAMQKTQYGIASVSYTNTEEFVEDMININETYEVRINCEASADGFRTQPIGRLIDIALRKYLPHNLRLRFYIESCSVPQPYGIWWKVRNIGKEAERRDCIRGSIMKTNSPERKETTNFMGPHYVECYIIKNGVCVAIGHIDVPIAGE